MQIPTLFRLPLMAGFAALAACGNGSTGTGQVAADPGVLQLAQSSYTVAVTAGTATVQVARSGGAAGAVSVNYATVDGTAVAGTVYVATSGTLSWADGDTADKGVSVTLKNATFTGNKSFQVAISAPAGGATLGTPASATVAVTPATTATGAGTLALSQASIAVAQTTGTVAVKVSRTGGSTGAVSVAYATADGTAMAGSQYTASSGSLSWANGDAADKTISVMLNATAFSGSKSFSVKLSAATGGATLGTASTATVSITGSSGGSSGGTAGLSLKIQNGHFLDASGNVVQLRGVNVSGLESVAVQGWSPANPWGGQTGTPTPDWNLIKGWGVNVVRLPLNEASWLGLQCMKNTSTPTTLSNPDPGANYQAAVLSSVAGANAAGLYVILDLHWGAPDFNGTPVCPTTQQPMADADHSLVFWTSLATAFKGNPAVIFELFNEPFVGNSAHNDGLAPGQGIAYGTAVETAFLLNGAVNAVWHVAGMQQMLDAVRATGAKNPVLVGSDSWSQQLVDFLKYPVTDSAGQLGAAWHPYPITLSGSSTPQARCVGLPGCSALQMQAAKDIIAAGYPVVVTEFGDTIATGAATTSSPWAQILLPWADTNGVSYLGWSWNNWTGFSANILITDGAGTPTNGYGAYVKQHLQCRAAGTASCP